MSVTLFVVLPVHAQQHDDEHSKIPQWIKSVADWWVQGIISDDEFLEAIEFLANNGMINVRTNDDVADRQSETDHEHNISKKANAVWLYGLEKEQSESHGEYVEGPTENGYEIAFYDVVGSDIVSKGIPHIPSELSHLQHDMEKHRMIWNVFANLIPESDRNVKEFLVTTDGVGEIGGGVERYSGNIHAWQLFFDVADAYPDGVFDEMEVTYTAIHEFGHIVTSNPDQIDMDAEMVYLSEEDYGEMYDAKQSLCAPEILVADGCAKYGSYINQFHLKFWTDIESEWDEMQYIEDDDDFYQQSKLFYEKYQDRFVSVYSSTNIDEDIAESWTAFVLNDRPAGKTISEEKILFFYDYPELMKIREHIRNNL